MECLTCLYSHFFGDELYCIKPVSMCLDSDTFFVESNDICRDYLSMERSYKCQIDRSLDTLQNEQEL